MYSTESLASPYCYIYAMMSRLYGQSDITRFSVKWVPLMEATKYAYGMDWGDILSNNIAT